MASTRLAWARATVIAALCGVAGCTQSVGDLGRTPSLSPERAYFAASPHQFNETDRERDMRDRIWRFLDEPQGGGRSGAPARPLRPSNPAATPSYYLGLSQASYASASTRYAALADDVEADLGTLPGTFAAICAVIEVDRQRTIAVRGLGGMEPEMHSTVAARTARNVDEIGRFAAALRQRFDGYSYALDHLLVETPHPAAVGADRLLGELERHVERAERGGFCDPHQGPHRERMTAPRADNEPIELEPRNVAGS